MNYTINEAACIVCDIQTGSPKNGDDKYLIFTLTCKELLEIAKREPDTYTTAFLISISYL